MNDIGYWVGVGLVVAGVTLLVTEGARATARWITRPRHRRAPAGRQRPTRPMNRP